MKKTNKLLALLLSAVMLISMLGAVALAEPAGALELEIPQYVEVVDEAGVDLTFTPAEDGYYSFISFGCQDATAWLFDSEGEEIGYNDDGSSEWNFMITASLTAGKTYTLNCRSRVETDSYTVTVRKSPVVGIEAAALEVYENTSGYWDEDLGYYHYYLHPVFTLEFENGDKVTGTDALEYDGIHYSCAYSYVQGPDDPWTLGNTYPITVTAAGLSAETTVTIVESPFAGLEVKDIEIIENTNGGMASDYDYETDTYGPEYYNYDVNAEFTVTLKDGTVLESEGGSVRFEGEFYSLDLYYEQSYENQWKVGNSYPVEARIFGMETEFSVKIVETPVASITFENESVIADIDGWYDSADMDPESIFFRYEWSVPDYTVTLKDGTVIKGEGYRFYYDGEWYYLDINDHQYENHWTVGNEYSVDVKAMGFKTSFKVAVEPSPAVSATAGKVTYVKHSNGYWNEENPEEPYYWYWIDPEFSVTLKDGTVLNSKYGGVNYNGGYYFFDIDYDDPDLPGASNPWVVGKEYRISGTVMGIETETVCSIVDSPVASIAVEDMEIVEGTSGYLDYFLDEETQDWAQYYRYSINPEFKATLKDGTVMDDFEYLGINYYLDTETDQSGENPWTVGNQYTVKATLFDLETTFKVTIVPSPFTDVVKDSYYEDAVAWAMDWGITTGTTETTFDPGKACSRAQIVTFLWRTAGCPEPENTTMPFTDVKEGAYYYDAVLWAVENGITTGKNATTFAPGETCNRAQIVTFLWRYNNERQVKNSDVFTDVKADAYYAEAVYWAAKEGITTGTSASLFSPSKACSRAQIVTFLYRSENNNSMGGMGGW